MGNDIEFDGNIVLSFAGTDAFLTKYDVNGNLLWYQLIGTPTTMTGPENFNSGNALKIDNNGDILLLRYFINALSFGTTTLESQGASDLLLLKYDPDGHVLTSGQYTAYGWVNGIDITIDNKIDIYLTGFTTLDKWDSRYPAYSFIAKIDQTIPTTPLSVVEISDFYNVVLYPNPTKGIVNLTFSEVLQKKKIEVFSIGGIKLKEVESQEPKVSFEINESGIYILLLTTDSHRIIKKIIVE